MKKALLIIFSIVLSISSFAQTWVSQGLGWTATPLGVMNISIVNPQVVWVAASDGSGAGLAIQNFSKTINGGTTWTPGTVSGVSGLSLSMITAINADTAWVAMYKVSGSTNGGVYKTTDGGTTWARQTTATFSNASSFPDFIYFWDANNGIVVGDPINNEFEVYTTTNGGTQWTLLPSAQIPVPLSAETAYTSDFCVVGNNIWFGTSKGRVYASTDQGQNWIVALPPGFTGKNSYPAFKDNVNGLALKFYTAADTLGLLKSSSDGGTSYSALTYQGSVLTGDIKYVPGSTNTYVTTGWDGTNQGNMRMGVTYSFDGGATWITDADINGTGLTCSSWLNDSTGWVGGFNSGTGDGIFKYNGVLLPPQAPVANFMTPDTLIVVGGTATFTNLSTGNPTSYLWAFPGGFPPTSTAQTPGPITYNTPGTHDVSLTVTNNNGSNTMTKSNYIHVGGVGINELSENAVSVFPNPVNDVMTVQASNNLKEIYLYNATGQLVINQTVNAKTITINTSGLTTGIYTLKAILDNSTINKKIVIQ
jgi:PKD repeat protein